ncbi:MAG: hypothetical protein ACREK4_02175, partial [Candidatus Rokuibacteriota bacterium]
MTDAQARRVQAQFGAAAAAYVASPLHAAGEDLDRLLAGAEIHLVNTDPPYNVRVEPRSNNAIA